MSVPAGQLLLGEVMHRRFFPVQYRFVYRIFSLVLDLDRIGELARTSRWFSHNRFNLFAFHDLDHGAGDGTPLRDWLLGQVERLGLRLPIERIDIQCMPRVLGYGFNPMTPWFCYGPTGDLVAILCEVHNTFGERHGYLLHQQGMPMQWPVRQSRAKGFHVSPFVGMQADYRFRFTSAGDESGIVIHEYQDDRLMLVAVQRGRLRPFTDANLLRAALSFPLLTFKVVTMIHWHALKIWLRGATYFPKPTPPREEVT
ncbi:DUF1365 domain-containing protein [uncultured Thiodictyon sp.]|uniref:DUF1365 domain-containing protein n=1 Tax=uncultured Thiodictyon sp. TaxID=1846217 RepID=UPI0025E8E852|nr:DUF1365 domain-containing protein [uncultured Thiodictyon sp.]